MIHLVVGPDHFLVERRVREIALAADPDRLNTTRLDKSASIDEVAGAVSTMGFFGTGRVVIAEGALAGASGAGKAKKAEAEDIGRLFSAVAPGNTLILVDESLHSVPSSVRDLKDIVFEEFVGKPERGSGLVKWVQDEVSREGGRIDRQAITELLNLLFPGTWQAPDKNPLYDRPPVLLSIITEVGKLITAAGGAEITADLVRNQVSRESQEQLFPVVDAVVSGNVRNALSLLGNLGDDDEVVAKVIGQLSANAELGPIAVGIRESEAKVIGQQIGQTDRRLMAIQRNYSAANAASLADVVIETDRRLKTGITRNPSGQLHDILVQLANKTRGR